MLFQDRDLVPEKKKKTGIRKILTGIALGAVLSQGAVFLVHSIWIFPWKSADDSMEPAVKKGDRLYINRLFNPQSLKKGDIVVVRLPENPELLMLRRVIALPGDMIEINSRKVYINGKPYHHEAEIPVQNALSSSPPFSKESSSFDDMSVKQILDKEIFVLSDNRNSHMDSRHFGPIPYGSFEGKAY